MGGRSGVGKTSVAYEVSQLWQGAGVAHCLIDGDNFSAAYPKPPDDPDGGALTEANLRAVWANYGAVGYRRLIYVNTVSVLERAMVVRAMGGSAAVHGVLLTATDETVRRRLIGREIGTALGAHLRRSATMAVHLDSTAEGWVVRVPTDGRPVAQTAAVVARETQWSRDT